LHGRDADAAMPSRTWSPAEITFPREVDRLVKIDRLAAKLFREAACSIVYRYFIASVYD
jgi:hypothetical protein